VADPDPSPGPDAGLDPDAQRRAVRERYARVAAAGSAGGATGSADGDGEADGAGGCCGTDACCGGGDADRLADLMGYDAGDRDGAAGAANLGLGCGNPGAFAALSAGETVLDLGSGAGFDCFLAGEAVGPSGRVIGVDMTPEMVDHARETARDRGVENVEFRLGEIEHLPVADGAVDVVISNCVVNLSPAKPRVFREAFRVLRPGGRLELADVVLTAEPPTGVRSDRDAVASCVGGATTADRLESMLAGAGFERVGVDPVDGGDRVVSEWDAERDPSEFLVSARITGRKPTDTGRDGAA
jgi:SAM-dependent methyltransferase